MNGTGFGYDEEKSGSQYNEPPLILGFLSMKLPPYTLVLVFELWSIFSVVS